MRLYFGACFGVQLRRAPLKDRDLTTAEPLRVRESVCTLCGESSTLVTLKLYKNAVKSIETARSRRVCNHNSKY